MHLSTRRPTGVTLLAVFAALVAFVGTIGVSTRQATAQAPLVSLPANLGAYFVPSGWMGDGESGKRHVQIDDTPAEVEGSRQVVTRITYTPGPKAWAGVYWQYPENNWGDRPGRSLRGARRIRFLARGERGGEIVEFKSGGIRGKRNQDSYEVSLGKVELSTAWRPFVIDLSKQDLRSVIGAFAWVAAAAGNRPPVIVYIADLRVQ